MTGLFACIVLVIAFLTGGANYPMGWYMFGLICAVLHVAATIRDKR